MDCAGPRYGIERFDRDLAINQQSATTEPRRPTEKKADEHGVSPTAKWHGS